MFHTNYIVYKCEPFYLLTHQILATFPIVWMISTVSPILLIILIYFGYYYSFSILFVLCLAAFSPWVHRIPALTAALNHHWSHYYRTSSLTYEDLGILKRVV